MRRLPSRAAVRHTGRGKPSFAFAVMFPLVFPASSSSHISPPLAVFVPSLAVVRLNRPHYQLLPRPPGLPFFAPHGQRLHRLFNKRGSHRTITDLSLAPAALRVLPPLPLMPRPVATSAQHFVKPSNRA